MTINVDASTPAVTTATGRPASILTASFTPPANSLLVAMVAAGWDSTLNIPVMTVSDSGSHTWTKKVGLQGTHAAFGGGTAIFYTYLTTAPGSITVTTAYSAWDSGTSGGSGFCDLVVLNGTASNQAAAAASSQEQMNVTTGTVDITTTTTGSLVLGISDDSGTADTFAANGNTTVRNNFQNTTDGVATDSWVATSATATPGLITLGGTWGAVTYSTHCAFEVLPAVVGAAPRSLIVNKALRRSTQY